MPVEIIPFSDELNFSPPEGSLFFYGSTSLIKSVEKSSINKDGFFFDSEQFRSSLWVKKLGKRMLNWDSLFVTLEEASKMEPGTFFMKPDNDLKDFSGSIVNIDGITKFYEEVSAGGFLFNPQIPVVLSPIKNTGWEYRCFMVNGKVVASSSYKLKSMLRMDKRVSSSIIQFAEESAQIWTPDKACVLDVCETDDGLKIVEFNCLNASGFYSCKVEDIVREVSRAVLD